MAVPLAGATVGTPYDQLVLRQPHTVALQRNATGTQITNATFAAGVAYNVPVGPNALFAGANWAVTTGALPQGLAIDGIGKITGTPTTAGTYDFTITVTAGVLTSSRALQIVVVA